MCELYLTKENCRKNQFGQNLPTLPQTAKHISFLRRVSVPCEGNRKGRKAYCGLVRMWSSPCRRDGEVEKSALRAVTSFPLMVKGKAWFRIKDPPAGEGQVGHNLQA